MKHIKRYTWVMAMMVFSTANTLAEGVEFNTPDISNRLTKMVEAKMDRLVEGIGTDINKKHATKNIGINETMDSKTGKDKLALVSQK